MTIVGLLLLFTAANATLAGLGMTVMRLAGVPCVRPADVAIAFWVGFGAALGLLQAYHFLFPISGYSTAPLVALGVVGWVVTLRSGRLRLGLRDARGLAALLLLAMIWMANRATGPVNQIDAGFYHLPAVQWCLAMREVPGLANLHYRLGFSTLYYPYAATFETLGIRHVSPHVSNALLLAAVLAMQLAGAWRVVVDRRPDPACAGLMATLPMTVFFAISKDASSVNTDVPVYCVAIATAWMLLRLIAGRSDPAASPDQVAGVAAGAIVGAATLVALKLSALVLGFGYALAALVLLSRGLRSNGDAVGRSAARRPIAVALVLSSLLAACLVGRNVVVSGHLLFPLAQTRLPLGHAVPAELSRAIVKETNDYPRLFLPRTFVGPLLRQVPLAPARALGERIASGDARDPATQAVGMLGTFATYGFVNLALPVTLAGLACLTMRRAATAGDATRGLRGDYAVLTAVAIGSLAYWLVGAAEPRFATASAWALLATSVAAATARASRHAPRQAARWRTALIAATAVATLSAFAYRAAYLRIHTHYHDVPLASLFWMPAPPGGGLGEAPVRTFRTFVTDHGLVVHMPIEDSWIYWGPLPSTPLETPGLAQRRDGDPTSGFEIRGKPFEIAPYLPPE